DSLPISKKNFKLLAELYKQTGDYKNAFDNQVKYDSVSSAILNDVVAKNLLQIQVDFEERQNLEIIALKDKEIGRRTTLLLLSIIISVLTVVIIFILYRNNKIRRRVNNKLTAANKTIESQNRTLTELNSVLEERVRERTEELRESNEALMKSNNDLDNFIYKTSHDIRGPLATLQGICNIALMDINDPMAVDYLQKLSKTAYKLNLILSKLLVINQINNALPLLEDVRLHNLVISMVDENKMSYFSKEISVKIEISKSLTITSDPDLLKIILGNLISNAFKFHNDSKRVDSFIIVRSCIEGDLFVFEVIDNGVGIEESVAHQIFDIFSKTSEIQDTAGLGLYLVKLATEKLDGKIEVKKSDEGDTLFRVTLPLN
ncbi:MAG: HAMP domain-containing sensor histidine kinase, partial [Fulvivirga sp.]